MNKLRYYYYEILDFLGYMAPIVIMLAVLLPATIVLFNAAGNYKCNSYAKQTGRETRWVFMDDCYINTDTGWQSRDEYIARSTASELLTTKGNVHD